MKLEARSWAHPGRNLGKFGKVSAREPTGVVETGPGRTAGRQDGVVYGADRVRP